MELPNGRGKARAHNLPGGTETFIFHDDGFIPNSSLPLIVRRSAIAPASLDPATAFESRFGGNGWSGAWRDGIFIDKARRRIATVPLPETDPVDGADGPLTRLWR
jgi:uncharacterized protein YjlB